jgi:four helix bundle protein
MSKSFSSDTAFAKWEQTVPEIFQNDALWRIKAYRLSLYISDIAWEDISTLSKDIRTRKVSDQLYRALGSISANIAESYSRSTGKAKALYLEYALGSARESRDWYYKSRFILGGQVVGYRLEILTQIIRLLLTMLPKQRIIKRIREENQLYVIGFQDT